MLVAVVALELAQVGRHELLGGANGSALAGVAVGPWNGQAQHALVEHDVVAAQGGEVGGLPAARVGGLLHVRVPVAFDLCLVDVPHETQVSFMMGTSAFGQTVASCGRLAIDLLHLAPQSARWCQEDMLGLVLQEQRHELVSVLLLVEVPAVEQAKCTSVTTLVSQHLCQLRVAGVDLPDLNLALGDVLCSLEAGLVLTNTHVQVVVDAAHHLGVEVSLERLVVGHGVDALEDGVALPCVRVFVVVVVDEPFVVRGELHALMEALHERLVGVPQRLQAAERHGAVAWGLGVELRATCLLMPAYNVPLVRSSSDELPIVSPVRGVIRGERVGVVVLPQRVGDLVHVPVHELVGCDVPVDHHVVQPVVGNQGVVRHVATIVVVEVPEQVEHDVSGWLTLLHRFPFGVVVAETVDALLVVDGQTELLRHRSPQQERGRTGYEVATSLDEVAVDEDGHDGDEAALARHVVAVSEAFPAREDADALRVEALPMQQPAVLHERVDTAHEAARATVVDSLGGLLSRTTRRWQLRGRHDDLVVGDHHHSVGGSRVVGLRALAGRVRAVARVVAGLPTPEADNVRTSRSVHCASSASTR